VHGAWSEWSQWYECNETCANSEARQFRNRTCTNPAPGVRGNDCPGQSVMENYLGNFGLSYTSTTLFLVVFFCEFA